MVKIVIDVDDGLLTEAAAVFRTSTPQDTVDAALRAGVERHRRTVALARSAFTANEGVCGSLFDEASHRS